MFHSTLPQGAPDLMRASEFRRSLREIGSVSGESSHLSDLSESLMQDLSRFEHGGQRSELLEVLAACMRHTEAVAVHLQWGERVLTLTVFPAQRLAHSVVAMDEVLGDTPTHLQVLQVERALLRPPGDSERLLISELEHYRPLAPVLWAIAFKGSREALLPEIAGQCAYRVVPGLDVSKLPLPSPLAACVEQLRRQTSNLREIVSMPGLDRARATRLLNALYLQAGLIVSRTHPAATNEGWFGYR